MKQILTKLCWQIYIIKKINIILLQLQLCYKISY